MTTRNAWVAGLAGLLALFVCPLASATANEGGHAAEQWVFGGLCGVLATPFYLYLPAFEGDLLALLTLNSLRPLVALRSRPVGRSRELQQAHSGGQTS